jgi:hypothetical protein
LAGPSKERLSGSIRRHCGRQKREELVALVICCHEKFWISSIYMRESPDREQLTNLLEVALFVGDPIREVA